MTQREGNQSRFDYYHHLSTEALRIQREEEDRRDFSLVLEAYQHRGYNKGARGIYMRLLHMMPPVTMNIKKIRRLMKKYGLFCPIRKANPYRRMAKAIATAYVAPNLLNREFESHGPRKALLTDITYIINGKAPRCYMCTIIDACTKELLAWSVSESLEVDFVLETVKQLIERYGVSLTTETLIHSDQGAHYKSIKFIQLVKDSDLRQSMSRRANCWDNAPQESFYGHMKDEIDISWCLTFGDIKGVIADWADYYNNERYQWDLARLAPTEYYNYLTTGIYPLVIPKAKGSGDDVAPEGSHRRVQVENALQGAEGGDSPRDKSGYVQHGVYFMRQESPSQRLQEARAIHDESDKRRREVAERTVEERTAPI
jgi:transposase InsO family protein